MIVRVIFIIVGFIQMFAIFAGLEAWWGLPWYVAGIAALFTTYIPLLGTVLGIMGAVKGWGWSYWEAGLLYGSPFIICLVAMLAQTNRARS